MLIGRVVAGLFIFTIARVDGDLRWRFVVRVHRNRLAGVIVFLVWSRVRSSIGVRVETRTLANHPKSVKKKN